MCFYVHGHMGKDSVHKTFLNDKMSKKKVRGVRGGETLVGDFKSKSEFYSKIINCNGYLRQDATSEN